MAVCLISASAVAAPRLVVRPDRLDFGAMKQGEKVRKVVRLENRGDRQLTIEQIRPSCAECVLDRVPTGALPPGEAVDLPVTFHAAALPGQHSAFIMIHSDDPNTPLMRIELTVEVTAKGETARLAVNPARCDLGVVVVNEPVMRTIGLRNVGTADLVFQEIAASPGVNLEGRPAGPLAPGQSHPLGLAVRATVPGILQGHIAIATNDPDRATVTVPVTGYAATPEEVKRLLSGVRLVPQRDGASGRLRAVRVVNGDAAAIQVRTANGAHVRTDAGQVRTDGGQARTDGGQARTDAAQVRTDAGEVRTDAGEVRTDGGEVRTDGIGVRTADGVVCAKSLAPGSELTLMVPAASDAGQAQAPDGSSGVGEFRVEIVFCVRREARE